ncbi:MAG: hypothetical protein QY326_02220 [Bdellovibrionota bacterium]|nr:MAG: hypothetical protein QY326_02220 [Bdellovibrionota bacterium]
MRRFRDVVEAVKDVLSDALIAGAQALGLLRPVPVRVRKSPPRR